MTFSLLHCNLPNYEDNFAALLTITSLVLGVIDGVTTVPSGLLGGQHLEEVGVLLLGRGHRVLVYLGQLMLDHDGVLAIVQTEDDVAVLVAQLHLLVGVYTLVGHAHTGRLLVGNKRQNRPISLVKCKALSIFSF